jgi:hypothetical protein
VDRAGIGRRVTFLAVRLGGRPAGSIDLRPLSYDRWCYGARASGCSIGVLPCGVTAVFDVGGYPCRGPAARDTRHPPARRGRGPLLSTVGFWLNLPAGAVHLLEGRFHRARRRARLESLGARRSRCGSSSDRPPTSDGAVPRGNGRGRRGAPGPALIVHATGLREARSRQAGQALVHSVWDKGRPGLLRLAHRQRTICPTLTVIDGYARLLESAGTARPAGRRPGSGVDSSTITRM